MKKVFAIRKNTCKRKKSRSKKGISLIALIITIIVVIILSVIVLSEGGSNTLTKAQEAAFRSDISTIKEQIGVYVSKQYAVNNSFDRRQMFGKLSDYFTRFEKYESEIEVFAGELAYVGTDEYKKEIAREMGLITDVVTIGTTRVNKPDLSYLPESTTYAITFNDVTKEPETMPLSQAKNDTSWYDYSSTAKKWANIKTTNNGNEAYWVWIPRYAYKIDNPHTTTAETIHIKFLAGTSNIPADGTPLGDYIVHPAFTFGGVELTGIWVAKFEASSSEPNSTDGKGGYTGGGDTTELQVRVLPNVYSWRYISTGNAQTVCANMTNSSGSVGTSQGLDTHQMKNSEWGAVAYLTQSIYGKNSEVWVNPYGDDTTCRMKTGYSGEDAISGAREEGHSDLNQYNTEKGQNASSTGNIYGIYDLVGGAREYVAAYIDNGNSRIQTHGTTTYFLNSKIRPQYAKYYDIYEPGDEEKEGAEYYGSGINELWNTNNSVENNRKRKALTEATYDKMRNNKGDAMYEVSKNISYYGVGSDEKNHWLLTEDNSSIEYALGWNDDYQLYGYGNYTWIMRGGDFNDRRLAGIFATSYFSGGADMGCGFRPVLVSGASL